MDQPRSKATVECSYKVRDELCRLLSPVYNVSIDDVADIINILNVIKADCAQTPEKFRLLIGLLCQVDLSIANIEEHYEQLLIKNRIFHLLRAHQDIAHPVLDVIARATNRCCPLTTMPRTLENQDKRCPAGVGLDQSPTIIKLSTPTKSNLVVTTSQGSTNPCTVSAPRFSQAFFTTTTTTQQRFSTALSNGPSVSSPQQPAAFDQSRKLYNQVPLSFQQSPLPGCSGIIVNSSGGRESPSDIQKRILLQRQRHLRQQLEMLQAQRLKETSCIKNLSFDGQTRNPRNAPSTVTSESFSIRLPEKTKSSTPGCSTNIGQNRFKVKPIRARQFIKEPIKIVDGKDQRISGVQALDLTSPRRRDQEVFNLVDSYTKEGNEAGPREVGPQALFEASDQISKEPVNEEQSVGLTLSHVGQHCIMVSIGDKSKETGAGSSQQVQVEVESAKQPARKQKKGKTTRAVVINVQKLCHMYDTRHKNKTQDQTLCPEASAPTAPSKDNCTAVNKQGDSTSTSQRHDESPDENLKEVSPKAQHQTISSNPDQSLNKNNNSITANPVLNDRKLPSKRKRIHRDLKLGNHKRQRSRKQRLGSGKKSKGDLSTKSSAQVLMPIDQPLDLSCTLSTPSQHFESRPNSLKATNAEFQPLKAGMWCQKEEQANKSSVEQTGPSTGGDDSDMYMLYAGCDDDEGWYQSHSDEAKSARVSQSSSSVNSPMASSETFLGRFVQERLQPLPPATAGISSMPRVAAAAAAAKAKRKHPKTRSRKDKRKRQKKH